MNLADKINRAITHHVDGDLVAAEAIYREVLAEDPRYPDAHNLLANLYYGKGDHLRALHHVNNAIEGARHPQFLNTRGMIFISMKKYQEAIADFREAVRGDAAFAEPQSNLCVAYRALKDYRNAIKWGRGAVALAPAFPDAWINLGAVYQDKGDLDSALATYLEASSRHPGHATALANIGKVHYQKKDFRSAVGSLEAALAAGFDGMDVRFAHAHSLIMLGETGAAAIALEAGLRSTHDWASLHGILVQDAFFQVLYQCCNHFSRVVNEPWRAIELYEHCGNACPDLAAIWNNLGTVYFNWGRFDKAIEIYRRAIEVLPSLPDGYNNIGVIQAFRKQSRDAIASFECALAVSPNFTPSLGWLLREKSEICDWKGFEKLRERVASLRQTDNRAPISPFVALSVFEDPADLHYWARLSADEIFAPFVNSPVLAKRKAQRRRKKIRLGYYSFDFRNHPVAHLTSRMFELHDRSRFDVYIYSYGPDDQSDIREHIKRSAKHFVDLEKMSVEETARRIAEDDIDFLIDLTGNTLHTRSQALAFRPARLQAHWLGFVGTMGSGYYDYILADDFVIPPGAEADFSEKILRLPGGMHMTDETRHGESALQTRAANNLPERGVVFGCFSQSFKIQPEIFALWMKVLAGVPGSVLWLASGPAGMEENLRHAMSTHGVDPARLVIAPRCGVSEYLSRFAMMDLYLDTFPYTSGTVASDALRAGCPLVALVGRSMVSRMAGSIVRHAGLPELACETPEAFVALATRLGNSPAELAALRQKLADARASAQLFDVKSAVRGLEELLMSVIKSGKPVIG